MSNNNNGSKVEYECGCTMQRASFHDLWQREYICGVHKSQLSHLPPVPDVAAKTAAFVLKGEPITREYPYEMHAKEVYQDLTRKAPLQPVVNDFTMEERNVILGVLAIRQFEVQREKREVRANYGDGETAALRLKALESEAQALKGAMNKLYLPGPLA